MVGDSMDPPHHIHTKSKMFYWEIRPKWPNMAISQVILTIIGLAAFSTNEWIFFLSETDANEYFSFYGHILGQVKKKIWSN